MVTAQVPPTEAVAAPTEAMEGTIVPMATTLAAPTEPMVEAIVHMATTLAAPTEAMVEAVVHMATTLAAHTEAMVEAMIHMVTTLAAAPTEHMQEALPEVGRQVQFIITHIMVMVASIRDIVVAIVFGLLEKTITASVWYLNLVNLSPQLQVME